MCSILTTRPFKNYEVETFTGNNLSTVKVRDKLFDQTNGVQILSSQHVMNINFRKVPLHNKLWNSFVKVTWNGNARSHLAGDFSTLHGVNWLAYYVSCSEITVHPRKKYLYFKAFIKE